MQISEVQFLIINAHFHKGEKASPRKFLFGPPNLKILSPSLSYKMIIFAFMNIVLEDDCAFRLALLYLHFFTEFIMKKPASMSTKFLLHEIDIFSNIFLLYCSHLWWTTTLIKAHPSSDWCIQFWVKQNSEEKVKIILHYYIHMHALLFLHVNIFAVKSKERKNGEKEA